MPEEMSEVIKKLTVIDVGSIVVKGDEDGDDYMEGTVKAMDTNSGRVFVEWGLDGVDEWVNIGDIRIWDSGLDKSYLV